MSTDLATEHTHMDRRDLASRLSTSIRMQNAVALLVILVFAVINLFSVLRGYSLTTDEDKHYLYGQNFLAGDPTKFDDSKMPVTGLNALPGKVASFLPDGNLKQLLARFYVARSVTILFSCLLAFMVFNWARQLYGFVPALFSLVLYVLDPNIIAHSQLVTTDLYVTCAIFCSFFFLWKFAHQRNMRNGLACLLVLGLSQIAKYTAIVLYPLFFIALFFFDLSEWKVGIKKGREIKNLAAQYGRYTTLAVIVSLIIINVGFLFNRSFTHFGDYQFRSEFFRSIQESSLLGQLPVPVPYPYLQGLDAIRRNEQTGESYGKLYLLGQLRYPKGFVGYFFIASLLKVPIATQIFLWLAIIVYFTDTRRRNHLLKNELFLLLPVLFFTIYLNFFFNTQIGIRYYLPVFPFLYVFTGTLFIGWREFSTVKRAASLALLAYLAVSVFSYYPYHISYFNEIVWDRTQAYKYLADSNLDWEQGKNELEQYLAENPDAVYKPKNVKPGHIIVRVNDLVGVLGDPDQYAWLRENFEPVDTIAYSYLVYQISPEELDQMCATTTYCNH